MMIFTGPVLYLALISSEIGKRFHNYLLYILLGQSSLKFTSITFFEIARENEKNVLPEHILPSSLKIGHMPKTVEKH